MITDYKTFQQKSKLNQIVKVHIGTKYMPSLIKPIWGDYVSEFYKVLSIDDQESKLLSMDPSPKLLVLNSDLMIYGYIKVGL